MKNNKVLIIAGVLVVLVIIVGFQLASPEKATSPALEEEPAVSGTVAFNGVLSFEPANSQYKKGEVFPVGILVDSDGQPIVGIDMMIKYDSDSLELKAQDGDLVKTEKGFFAVFPAEGQIKSNLFQFSILSQNPQVLDSKIATIYFLAKKSGETKLEFQFEAGKTTDSNLASYGRGEDILASVVNAVYQIVK